MTVTLGHPESHSDDSTTIEVLVEGPTTRLALFTDLLANLPVAYDTFGLQKIESADKFDGHDDLWKCRVRYGAYRQKSDLKSGEMEFNFAASLETFTRTISSSSKAYDANGEMDPAPEDVRIIGWKPESRQAMGVQDTQRVESFAWTIIVPTTTADVAWMKSTNALVNTLNNATFFGYAAEEVKLLNVDSTIRSDGEYRMRLQFARKPTLTDYTIGGITIPTINGWDILDTPDTVFVESDGLLVPKVKRVKVHKGLATADWSALATLLGV